MHGSNETDRVRGGGRVRRKMERERGTGGAVEMEEELGDFYQ